jgi:iodotyrosine deiodinase
MAHIPLTDFQTYPEAVMLDRSMAFYHQLKSRRSIRFFSGKSVPREVIENCLLTAGSAPNGANLQPWQFVVVQNPEVKKQIREGAEKEEQEFYNSRAPQEWLDALAPLGTDANKPFLETAPYLIAIFSKSTERLDNGKTTKNYYALESTGIATGFLVAALHNAGLACLTHTPSPMNFLNQILNRPSNEKPFLLLVVGYPSENCTVPDISKKPLSQIAEFV